MYYTGKNLLKDIYAQYDLKKKNEYFYLFHPNPLVIFQKYILDTERSEECIDFIKKYTYIFFYWNYCIVGAFERSFLNCLKVFQNIEETSQQITK